VIDGLQEHGVLIHDGEVYQDVIIAQEEGSNNSHTTQDILVYKQLILTRGSGFNQASGSGSGAVFGNSDPGGRN
jgi:hypothetical protein